MASDKQSKEHNAVYMFHGKKCCFGLFLSVNKHPKSDSGACTVGSPQPQKEERLGKNTSTETRFNLWESSSHAKRFVHCRDCACPRGCRVSWRAIWTRDIPYHWSVWWSARPKCNLSVSVLTCILDKNRVRGYRHCFQAICAMHIIATGRRCVHIFRIRKNNFSLFYRIY